MSSLACFVCRVLEPLKSRKTQQLSVIAFSVFPRFLRLDFNASARYLLVFKALSLPSLWLPRMSGYGPKGGLSCFLASVCGCSKLLRVPKEPATLLLLAVAMHRLLFSDRPANHVKNRILFRHRKKLMRLRRLARRLLSVWENHHYVFLETLNDHSFESKHLSLIHISEPTRPY